MNFNNFTIKSQEAVQQAVNITQARGQQAIEPVHLLAGVLKVGENVTNFIFQKLGMNAQQIALSSTSKLTRCLRFREENLTLAVKATRYYKEPYSIPKRWVTNSFHWKLLSWPC